MTIREFFTHKYFTLIAIITIGIGFFVYNEYIAPRTMVVPVEEMVTESSDDTLSTEPPVFTWKFDFSETLNRDGLPNTELSLKASYGGDVVTKVIATVPGSCNELPDNQKDSVANSTDAQCYAAGIGDRFKIVKGVDSYQVMRQEFEEGMPEYNPPIQEYKVVAEFPFAL